MEAGATGTVRLADPDVAVTLYSEAVAKGSYAGSVTVSDRTGLVLTPEGKPHLLTKTHYLD